MLKKQEDKIQINKLGSLEIKEISLQGLILLEIL